METSHPIILALFPFGTVVLQILVANLQESSVSPADVDWTRPTAFVMGNELSGPTSTALEMADGCIAIPMDGFVESFNVSVAASLIMWEARRVRLEKTGKHGNLTEAEQRILLALMFLRGKGMSRQYASELLKRLPPAWYVTFAVVSFFCMLPHGMLPQYVRRVDCQDCFLNILSSLSSSFVR